MATWIKHQNLQNMTLPGTVIQENIRSLYEDLMKDEKKQTTSSVIMHSTISR
jgi:hypothetical protein